MTIIGVLTASSAAVGQRLSLDDFKRAQREAFNSYTDSLRSDYAAWRERLNREYAEFLSKPWVSIEWEKGDPVPPRPRPVVKGDENVRVIHDGILHIDTVYVPLPTPIPRPRPIVRQDEERRHDELSQMSFEYFGTPGRVRSIASDALMKYETAAAGDAWMALWRAGADAVVADMISLRDERGLCDWAYRGAVEAMSKAMLGDGILSTLLNGYVMSNSGYKVRFVSDDAGNVYVAYATDIYLYNVPKVWCGDAMYYVADARLRDREMTATMCDVGLPGEQPLSMHIDKVQNLALNPSDERVVDIKYHNAQGHTVRARVNRNIAAFYDTYPKVWGNGLSPWQIVAEIPADKYLTDRLYPQLRELIKGMGQEDAVNTLMGVCQTFPYGYDDQVWGYDYPLTVEQTWYHPSSDCEDHAIHLSRLVRDLLGLETSLIYLPRHLVTGIIFTDCEPEGSRVDCDGKSFLICDPTNFGEKIGRTFVATDTDETKVYLLRKQAPLPAR